MESTVPHEAPPPVMHRPVRPIGAWVVGGFLLVVTLAFWLLVALIFQYRS